ncbi:MAG: 2-oxo-4-hydroxy-4-carboxy-5-ureidoimidazoline decarboxylase [Chloroflexota bacterium]
MSDLDVDLDRLNAATPADASTALAPLFEGAPRFLGRLVAARPFRSWDELFEVARAIARTMPEAEQVELIDAHPRLGAAPGTVSALSFVEQGYDRLAGQQGGDRLAGPAAPAAPADLDVAAELDRLNAAYEARFGFRYCVFVAGRAREALLPGMAAALGEDRRAELHRAIDAVVDIAVARAAALGGSRG